MTDAISNNPLAELVGEGKKFKTVEDLALSKLESDRFIGTLSDENKTLRKLLASVGSSEERDATVQAILQKFQSQASSGNTQPTGTTPEGKGAAGGTPDSNQSKPVSREEVRQLLLEMERAKQAEENIAFVTKALGDKFGDPTKATEAIKVKAAELGVTEDTLNSLKASSPKAFLRMLGLDATSGPLGGSVTTRGATNPSIGVGDNSLRNKAYYDKLKTEMGIRKFVLDQKLQQQMYKDMRELGDRF